MNLETVYFASQVAAACAVVASLIFVGLQVRHATKAVRATSHHAITDSFNQLNSILASDTEAARRWAIGNEDPEKLTFDERLAWTAMMLAYMRIFETIYFQNVNGTLDRTLYQSELQTLEWMVRMPGLRFYWTNNPVSFSPEFRQFIAAMIERAEPLPSFTGSFGISEPPRASETATT